MKARRGSNLVYAIKCEGFFKVGRANDLFRRLEGLQCGNPFPLTIAFFAEATEKAADAAEAYAHAKLSKRHHRDEWFAAPIEDVKAAIREGIAEAEREIDGAALPISRDRWIHDMEALMSKSLAIGAGQERK